MSTLDYKAWPYREADAILEKLEREQKAGLERKSERVILETGYGPSGFPHVGTFSEVARTDYVRQALAALDPSHADALLYAFSDDMDGMRGIGLGMPHEQMREHLGKPLSDVPDPFGEHESFAAHMNAKLRSFLDAFGFDYVFKSAAEQYRSGVFDEGLKRIVDRYDAVRERCVEELRAENAETWSPFLPTCEHCGRNTTTRVVDVHAEDHTVSYVCDKRFNAKILSWEEMERSKKKQASKDAPPYWEHRTRVEGCGGEGRVPVTGGHLKVGWKVDWALRWFTFGVDYEMYGKDLIESATVAADLVRILGGEPPVGMVYEWFNDANNESISKSKGNGVTVEQWLEYGPVESLGWFVYQSPEKSKKLFLAKIAQATDQYLKDRARYGGEEEADRVNNPIHFVERARIAEKGSVGYASDLMFGTLINMVGVLGTDDAEVVWEMVERYDADAEENRALIEDMIRCALAQVRDFGDEPSYEAPPEEFEPALEVFMTYLRSGAAHEASAEEIQNTAYAAAKDLDLPLRGWFKAMYRLLLGQDRGPRLGTFVSLYGVDETVALVERRLAELAAGDE